jgi:hypothetical protein
VRHAAEQGVGLEARSLATLQSFHPAIGAEVQSVLTPKGSLASRNVLGGTAPEQVRRSWRGIAPASAGRARFSCAVFASGQRDLAGARFVDVQRGRVRRELRGLSGELSMP